MKKLMLILSTAVLIMAACSKSSNPKPALTPQNATIADISAKWLATVDTTYTIVNNKTTVTVHGNTDGEFFRFNTDNTGSEGDSTTPVLQSFTFTLTPGTITLHIPATSGNAARDAQAIISAISSSTLSLTVYDTNVKQILAFIKQ